MILCPNCGKVDLYVIRETVVMEKIFTADGQSISSKRIKYAESERLCPNCHREVNFLMR